MSQITVNSSGVIPPSSGIQTITGNTGGAVGPDGANNIDIIGDGSTISISGNPPGNTLTVAVIANYVDTVNGDTGSAIPALGIIGIAGGTGITTSASGNTVVIDADGTIATQYDADSGSAVPAGGILNIVGASGITTSAAGDTVTISATGADVLAYTNVNTSPYVVLSDDEYLGVDSSGGAITVQLPDAPSTGRVYYIKDRTGSADTNNITVTTVGGAVNIDGATSFVMNTEYQSVNVLFDGSTYQIF